MEQHTNGLGRRRVADARDHNFLIKAVLPKSITKTSQYWFDNGWWGDQGYTSQCVGYSLAHFAEDGPVTQTGTAPIIKPSFIYNEARKIDEWEGEDYDGTSVRAGAKVLQREGFISSFLWAWDLKTMIDAVLMKGPVVVGTTWYESMFYPDSKGLIKVGGNVAGGHAWVVNGVNTKTKLFRLKNSWGKSWGLNGRAFISFDDMDFLIKDYGEILLAVENKK